MLKSLSPFEGVRLVIHNRNNAPEIDEKSINVKPNSAVHFALKQVRHTFVYFILYFLIGKSVKVESSI